MLQHIHTISRRQSVFALPRVVPSTFSQNLCNFLCIFIVKPLPLPMPWNSLLFSRRHSDRISTDVSAITTPGLAASLISKCPSLSKKSVKSLPPPTINEIIFLVFEISPSIARTFLLVSSIKPEDVLHLLQAVQCSKSIRSAMAASMWEMFKWSSCQDNDFRHLPQSFPTMAAVLVRFHLLEESEFLLTIMQKSSFVSHWEETFSVLISGYINESKSQNALHLLDKMTVIGLSPSAECFRLLLNYLVKGNHASDAIKVFSQMVELGVTWNRAQASVFRKLVNLLSFNGMLQQCRDIVRKVMQLGYELDPRVLNYIAMGYSTRHEFDLFVNFCTEMEFAPDVVSVNRLMSYLCRNYSVADADAFMRQLQSVGFSPDAVTMGILISWSCHGRNLKMAFGYLSEISYKSMKPDVCSYNSIICGLFEENLWCHAMVVFEEMEEMGVRPNLSTFRVFLAGYCRARRFDEARSLMKDMVRRGLIQSNSVDIPLSSVFSFLGINPDSVKIRRVNDKDGLFFGAEFQDELGNGLVLETNHDVFDKTLSDILKSSIVVDFNSLVTQECTHGELKTVLSLVESMGHWGQELSQTAFSALLKHVGGSHPHSRMLTSLFERNTELVHLLEEDHLNHVVQIYGRTGYAHKGMALLKKMIQRKLKIRDETYTALVLSFCTDYDPRGLDTCWESACRRKWLPSYEDSRVVVRFLCKNKEMVKVLELLDVMIESHPNSIPDLCFAFFEELCTTGNTGLVSLISEDLAGRGCVLDTVLIQRNILKGLCTEKKFREASVVMGKISSNDVSTSLDVSSLLHLGKVEDAAHLFGEMLRTRQEPGTEVYNLIVRAYCQVHELKRVWELLCVLTRNNVTLSLSTFRRLVRMVCLGKRISPLLGLKTIMLRQGNIDSIIIYNILLFYLLNYGIKAVAEVVLDEMRERSVKPDEVTYNFITYGFSCCNSVPSSLVYMDHMVSEGHKPNRRSIRAVICSLLAAENGVNCISEGKALGLSRLLGGMGCTHGSVVQDAVVGSLISRGNLDEADRYLTWLAEKGLLPNHVCYDPTIKKLCDSGRLHTAVRLVDTMLVKGSVPSSATYDSLVRGFCLADRVDDSLIFHREMLFRRLRPTVHTWNTLVSACCRAGMIPEAERLLKCMVRTGESPTDHMYNSIIDRYRAEGNTEKAAEVLREMQKLGLEPRFQTQWSLITALSYSMEEEEEKKEKEKEKSPGILGSIIYGTNSHLLKGKLSK